jgi:hypothetical protein
MCVVPVPVPTLEGWNRWDPNFTPSPKWVPEGSPPDTHPLEMPETRPAPSQ